MNIKTTRSADIVIRSLSEEDAVKFSGTLESLKNWKTDARVTKVSEPTVPLQGAIFTRSSADHAETYMLRDAGLTVVFSAMGDEVLVIHLMKP